MTELEQLAESLACAVLDGDHGAASQLAQTYRARARREREAQSGE